MKKKAYIFLFITLILLLSITSPVNTTISGGRTIYAKDHIIVKLKRNNLSASGIEYESSVEKILKISGQINVSVNDVKSLFPNGKKINQNLYNKYNMSNYFTVFINDDRDIPEICSLYEKNYEVEFAEPDFIGEAAGKKSFENLSLKPNDEFFDRQWGLSNDGTVSTTSGRHGKSGADMNVLNGWDIEKGSDEVIVAILDSGVKLDHPDLRGRIWVNKNETRNGRDDDGNGYADDINGWNFAYSNSNVMDDGGHGTNIAGTIGAIANNSIGYAGIDQHCKLMICKDLDEENKGEYSWWSSALYYAASNGARVINMSEGGYDYSKTLVTAVDYACDSGCLIVASMMNQNNSDSYYPASLPNVMAVGATDTDDWRCRQFTWGGGSNWGKNISVVAPGNRIYGLDFKDNNNYDVYWSGTSQATAYVTGIASLLISQDPSRTNKVLREIICSTAKDQVGDPREDVPGWDEYYGWGRVDLYDALSYGKTSNGKREIKDKNNENSSGDNDNNGNEQRAKALERKSSNDNGSRDEKRAKKIDR